MKDLFKKTDRFCDYYSQWIRIYKEGVRPSAVNRKLVGSGIDVDAIYESGVSLEDYFKKLVSEGADE